MNYGLDVDHVRLSIIRPVLRTLDLWSEAAENLVLGTALQESHLIALHQYRGPAMGVFQMEPATHADIHANYLVYLPELHKRVNRFAGYFYAGELPDPVEMIGNLYYACAMCRVHYRRVAENLPAATDAGALASYYKRHFNTTRGKATVAQALPHFYRAVQA